MTKSLKGRAGNLELMSSKVWDRRPAPWNLGPGSGRIFRAHFSLYNGLELVGTMVWNLSDQGSLRSGTRLIRGGFKRTSSALRSSSAHSSDQRSLRPGTVWSEVTLVWDGLIRDNFERDLNLGNEACDALK